MFFKVPALEEFKLPINFSTSALSTPEKWKVGVIVIVSLIFLTLGSFSYFLVALFTGSLENNYHKRYSLRSLESSPPLGKRY